jgi:hypothetical protein
MNSRTIPFTAAYVDPAAKHEDAAVDGWIGNPSTVEWVFAYNFGKGSEIPEDYLDTFESELHDLFLKINGQSPDETLIRRNVEIKGQLFYVKVNVDINPFRIVLTKIYLRPCAEKKGLFRILLFHIARCCSMLNCDMFIECPLKPTVRVLQRAFGSHLEGSNFVEIRRGPGDELEPYYRTRAKEPNYLLIRKEILRGMSQWGIAFRLGLVFDSSIYMSTCDLILHDTFKQARIKLNRVNPIFPPADIMNYGPPPPTCGTFTVKSMKKAPNKLSKR